MRRERPQKKPPQPTVTIEVEDMRVGKDKSLCTADMPDRILMMAKLGLSIAQMAQAVGVHSRTLNEWLATRPEIRKAYEDGKHVFDYAVQLALQQRAVGYTYKEVKTVEGKDVNGRKFKTKYTTEKHMPADSTAAIFWLKNRDPENWRDVNKNENTFIVNNTENNLNLDVLSEKEKKLLRSAAIKTISTMNGLPSG